MSTARFNTLQNAAGSKSVPVDTVVDGSAKAWVNFNGTGTIAIRAAFNVSSITDVGTGQYTVNFATAMADANYAVLLTSTSYSYGQANTPSVWYGTGSNDGVTTPTLRTTTQLSFVNGRGNSISYNDAPEFNCAAFR